MKKILLLLVVFCAAQFASAQFLQVESCTVRKEKRCIVYFLRSEYIDQYYSTIKLSNGDKLVVHANPNSKRWYWEATPAGGWSRYCDCNLSASTKYAKGTLVYKYPRTSESSCAKYELATMKKIGTYVIKSCRVREINVEMNAQADYSQKSFYVFMVGGKSSASGSYRAHGGPKTVVNVVFTNGMTASIVAADDPIWLEAKPGQKVEHYKVKEANIYKLLF